MHPRDLASVVGVIQIEAYHLWGRNRSEQGLNNAPTPRPRAAARDRIACPRRIAWECGHDPHAILSLPKTEDPAGKGGSERTHELTIEKNDRRLAIFNVYVEQHREHLSVNKERRALTDMAETETTQRKRR